MALLTRAAFGLLGVFAASGCANLLVEDHGAEANVRDFQAAWETIGCVYPYLSFKGIDWQGLYPEYRARAEKARGDEIYPILFDLLAELRDVHAGLTTLGGYYMPTYESPRALRDRRAFDPEVVRRYATSEFRMGGGRRFEYGLVGGNFGYLRLSTFAEGDWVREVDGALESLCETTRLILDVRHNDGGAGGNACYLVRGFLSEPLAPPPMYRQGEEVAQEPLRPRRVPWKFSSIAVLINGVSCSAAELFAEMMKQLPHVTLVGDTTAGGSGSPEYFRLPSGIKIRVPTTDLRRYDGLPFEWLGVSPDVRVPQTEADVRSGRDLQLESALAVLQGGT